GASRRRRTARDAGPGRTELPAGQSRRLAGAGATRRGEPLERTQGIAARPHRQPASRGAGILSASTDRETGDGRTERDRIRAIVAASSGNLVEWFDFYVYAFTAIYFAGAFFPESDGTAQLLKAAGVFAAGFLMRPIGSWL